MALKGFDDVAALLDVTPAKLRYYLYSKVKNYTVFEIPKRAGGRRNISCPVTPLKLIQQKLNQVLQAVYRSRGPVHGFVHGRSIKSNAEAHKGCRLVLNIDLADFFPSIHFGRVKGLLQSKAYQLPDHVALVLAQICCHEKTLPVGAPTSPVLANMVCAPLDAELVAFAKQHHCFYTRYADDITFSTDRPRFAPAVAYRDDTSHDWIIGDELKRILKRNTFRINEAKTRVFGKNSRQEITGLVVNSRTNVKRRVVRQVRAMLHAWGRYGLAAAQDEFRAKYDRRRRRGRKPDFDRVVRGKVEFIGFIRGRDDVLYLRLAREYQRVSGRSVRPVTITAQATAPVLGQAVWQLLDEGGDGCGTAFALEGRGLITAAHVLERGARYVTRLGYDDYKRYGFTIMVNDTHRDVAQLHVDAPIPVQLALGPSDKLAVGTPITLVGFPEPWQGAQVAIAQGQITQPRKEFGLDYWAIDAEIVEGNSGGPILDNDNRVVGIAVKGRGDKEHRLSNLFIPTHEWENELATGGAAAP
jgi:RNA-directed DNA polymerase